MIHSAVRHGKRAVKRALKACGLGPPLRAIERRLRHTVQIKNEPSLGHEFDRTRISIAVQAEMTRAAIAHETDLIRAVLSMQAASMAAALAEQSEQARSLLSDLIEGYHSENRFAVGSTGHDVGDSERDARGALAALHQKLQSPLTAAEIIGACKVICTQLPQPEQLRELLHAHRRDSFGPAAVRSRLDAWNEQTGKRARIA
jgi:aminopeptidase N